MDQQHAAALPEEAAFTARDRKLITARLGRYKHWTLEFATSGGIHYAHMRANHSAPFAPHLMLVRNRGLTGLAATWPDGRQFRASLDASLAHALGYLADILDGALDDGLPAPNAADPAQGNAPEHA